MVLSDNCTYEVTIKDDTSYYVATNDAGVKVKFNVVPVNVLHVDRESGYGTVKIWAEFKGKRSSDLDLVISHEMVKTKDLRSVRLDVVNDAFSDLAGSATAQLEVEVLLNDSSIILIKNFSIYYGLMFFTCNKSDTVTVNHVIGVVTLLSDSPYPVSVTATISHNPSIAKAAVFFCNTIPGVGEIDIGQIAGPAIPTVKANQRIELPIRVNFGNLKLLAFDLSISFDERQIIFGGIVEDTAFTYNEGKLRIADVLHPGTSLGNIYPRVATVILQSRIKGILNIWGSVNILIDENLYDISTAPNTKT